MGYRYKSAVSGNGTSADELFVTRCEKGHLQMVVTSGSTTGLICVKPGDVAGVIAEMRGYALLGDAGTGTPEDPR